MTDRDRGGSEPMVQTVEPKVTLANIFRLFSTEDVTFALCFVRCALRCSASAEQSVSLCLSVCLSPFLTTATWHYISAIRA